MAKKTRGPSIEERLAALLKRAKTITVLAKVPSDTDRKKRYDICMTGGNQIYCVCDAWKFSKDKDCKHLRRFREECVTQELPRR